MESEEREREREREGLRKGAVCSLSPFPLTLKTQFQTLFISVTSVSLSDDGEELFEKEREREAATRREAVVGVLLSSFFFAFSRPLFSFSFRRFDVAKNATKH